MKVSIITATYNSEATIETCIHSVLEQSYPNIEYLIMDGQSKDGTLTKVKQLIQDHEHVQVISEPDKGIYDALNKGVTRASGDLIGFVHSDDLLASKDIIQQIVERCKVTSCDGVYGDLHYVAASNTSKLIRNWTSRPFSYKLLKAGWMPAHPSLYLKKEVYEHYGQFDLSYNIAADYDFILRVFKNTDLVFEYIPEVIVKMRVGGASNRSLKNILQKSREDYRALRANHIGNWWSLIQKNTSKIRQFLPLF
jgi:glycosyltransferase involved in cell wall biosynthesis